MTYTQQDVTAIILAGGRGRRLNNQNKGLISLAGKTLLSRILDRLEPQTQQIIINANRDISCYQTTQYPVIQDKFENNQGPLAGILSCREHINTPLVLTLPCDAPLFPKDLLSRLLMHYNAQLESQLCVAHDGKRMQNLFMLFHRKQFDHMSEFFQNNNRKVQDWIHGQQYAIVNFATQEPLFVNINTAEMLNTIARDIDKYETK